MTSSSEEEQVWTPLESIQEGRDGAVVVRINVINGPICLRWFFDYTKRMHNHKTELLPLSLERRGYNELGKRTYTDFPADVMFVYRGDCLTFYGPGFTRYCHLPLMDRWGYLPTLTEYEMPSLFSALMPFLVWCTFPWRRQKGGPNLPPDVIEEIGSYLF